MTEAGSIAKLLPFPNAAGSAARGPGRPPGRTSALSTGRGCASLPGAPPPPTTRQGHAGLAAVVDNLGDDASGVQGGAAPTPASRRNTPSKPL